MQAIQSFSKDYLEPVINHPITQLSAKVGVEVVKILAIKIFFEYIGNQYLNNPKKISRGEVYVAVVLAPIVEELAFRLVLLQGIQVAQLMMKNKSYDPSEKKSLPHYSLVEEIFCHDQIGLLSLLIRLVDSVFNRIHITSSYFINGLSLPIGSAIQINLPFELDLIYQIAQKGINSIKTHINGPIAIYQVLCCAYFGALSFINPMKEMDEDEDKKEEKIKKTFRIHLAALIFAAAHLANPHADKMGALMQFSWSFLGGIIYGHLTEKYSSLFPGMIVHGINNSIAIASNIYSKEVKSILLAALVANRVFSYILAVT